MLRCETTSPLTVTYWPTWYRSLFVIFLPSSSQLISGVGFPPATHFRNTDGPGWRVSSGNASRMIGGSNRPPSFSSALA
uniref:Putative secreted protein n=1 Tax=Anopheles darlingi TaxID=43151 RepID=A0A2M4DL41_ANODA